MKSGRVFWGTLLVILGLLGVLHDFFSVSICWDALWKLWPLLLVLLGLSAFLKDSKSKWIVVGGIGLLAGVVIFASVQRGCNSINHLVDGDDGGWQRNEQELSIQYDSTVRIANFTFEGGAGHFEMADSTREFASASVRSDVSEYVLEYDSADGVPTIRLQMADESVSWKGSKMRNNVKMRLHPDPLWNLNIDAGAAKIAFDLRPFRIGVLDVEAGAASIEVRLGTRADTTNVRIQTGASSVHLYVPSGAVCELRTESALSSRHVRGFESKGDGLYRTGNFDKTAKRIFIAVDSGLSA